MAASAPASTPAVFSAEQLAFVGRAHVEERLAPAALVAALNGKFGTAFTAAQVRRRLRVRGGQPGALRSDGAGEHGSEGEGEQRSKGAEERVEISERAAAAVDAACPSDITTPPPADARALSPAPALPLSPAPPAATADAHARLMEEFARKSEQAARRALDMALVAEDPRTVSAAAGAAKSLISTFRLCAGLDGADADAPDAATFNFNFGNAQPLRDGDPAESALAALAREGAREEEED